MSVVGLRAWARRLRMDTLTVKYGIAMDGMLLSDWRSKIRRSTVKAFWGLWFGVCDTRVWTHGVMEVI